MADLTPANDDIAILPKEKGAKRQMLRRWVLRASLALTILGPLVFVVAAIGYKLGLFGLGTALGTLTREIGPLVLMVGAVLAVLAIVLAFAIKPRKGLVIGLIGLVVPLLGLGKLAGTQKAVYETYPFIHDVTTDTQDVPTFGDVVLAERAAVEGVNSVDYVGKMAPTFVDKKPSGEKLVSALQTQYFPEIRPLVLSEDKAVVFGEALATAKSMGWAIKAKDPATGRIDATDTTFWYGFEDDVTIRIREGKGGGTILDVRSISRIGGSDLGKNAERVEAFLAKMAAND